MQTIQPKFAVGLLTLLAVFLYIVKLIISIRGLFAAVAIYLILLAFGLVETVHDESLITKIWGLPKEYQIAGLSAIMTIIGFFVALSISGSSWKAQLRGKISADAAFDIDKSYSDATKLITEMRIFCETTLRVVNSIKAATPRQEVILHINFVNGQIPKFFEARDRFSKLAIDVYDFESRYAVILASLWNAINMLRKANTAIGDVANNMWIIVPSVDTKHPDSIEHFLVGVNEGKYNKLIESCKEGHSLVPGLAGAVKGQLLHPIVIINLHTIRYLIHSSANIRQFICKLRK